MGDKNRKAGLLVGGIFISLALVFLLISIGIKHVSVIKNDTLSEKESVSSYTDDKIDEDVWGAGAGDESTGNTSEEPEADSQQGTGSESSNEASNTEGKTGESVTGNEAVSEGTSAETSSEGTESNEKMVDNTETPTGVDSWTEINESSIDYSVAERSTGGVVNSKKVYLTKEGTLVYSLGISCKINGEEKVLSYYCGYSAYDKVKENDLVTVKYKEPTDNTILISRVEVN